MFAIDKTKPSEKIGRCNLDQLRKSIEAWEIMGEAASQNGEAELAAILTECVTDLRNILRLMETGEHHQAAEAIYNLDKFARDQIRDAIYNAIVTETNCLGA